MIPARKNEAFARLFAADAERRIRGAFHSVNVRGLETLATTVAREPVLVVSNHTAWWDPLFVILVTHRLVAADAYAMMDARNLERLPFFANVGAFGVDLTNRMDGLLGVRHAAKLLSRPQRLVWIFAQGKEVPITARPLGFFAGSAAIAQLSGAAVVPAALRYEMGATPEPTAWLSFGDPILRDTQAGSARDAHSLHERRVAEELDAIDAAIVSGAREGFDVLFEKESAVLFELAQSALAWMTKPRGLSILSG